MFFENHEWRQDKSRHAVTGPGSHRRHDQPAEQDQSAVIINTPACKIPPGLFTVCFDGQTCRGKLVNHFVKFTALNTDRRRGIMRVLWAGDIEVIRNATEG